MKVNLTGNLLAIKFISLAIYTSLISITFESKADNFIAQLKTHYQETRLIKSFSMTHNYLYLGQNGSYVRGIIKPQTDTPHSKLLNLTL